MAERKTKRRAGYLRRLPVAAGVTCEAGKMAAITATGYATPGATSTTLKGIGRFEETVDNSSGGAGDEYVNVLFDIFAWENSAAADEIDRGDIGSTVYIVDDETVALTDGTGTRSPAGEVFEVDSDGVWVKPAA